MAGENSRALATRRATLNTGWELAKVAPGAATTPSQLVNLTLDWRSASVPGTVAASLRDAGDWSWSSTEDFDAPDWWYRCRFNLASNVAAPRHLCFEGLATFADVWLNGRHILRSDNMFVANDVDVTEFLTDDNELIIRFKSLDSELAVKRGRGRWRTRMVAKQQLRWIRTTLLGRMPGWSSSPQTVGPWRPIHLDTRGAVHLQERDVRTRVVGQDGVADVVLRLATLPPGEIERATLTIGNGSSDMEVRQGCGAMVATGTAWVPNAKLWWPHTHGEPYRYPAFVTVRVGGDDVVLDLGHVAFRAVTHDTTDNGFAVRVNGQPIFCRGACWSTIDVVSLTGDESAYRDALLLARDAGMNMLRVGGTMVYESDTFYELCDELGIMVWQDFMFSNMDYPADDDDFLESVYTEIKQFVNRVQSRPCIVLFCGNNEVAQQAAMLGMPAEHWVQRLFARIIPEVCHDSASGAAYWPSSPNGGTLPFHCAAGDAHYFGYGPYLRAFDDVRSSDVRFASECLAFANVPDLSTIDLLGCGPSGAAHHPEWKGAVPRDNGSSWDFEDVRDHYLEELFKQRPAELRRSDVDRYLALSRVASGEVMARALGEWRRARSSCNGALIWFYRDLRPGAGWGLVDSQGQPKAAYYYVRRASRPVTLILSDEGLNGIVLDAVNDSAASMQMGIDLTLFRNDVAVVSVKETLVVPAHAVSTIHGDAMLGRFADPTYAYRFGPPGHDLIVATLSDLNTGETIADAFHFPRGLPSARVALPAITAKATPIGNDDYLLELWTEKFAQSVAIEANHFRSADNYFHIPPGSRRTTVLRALSSGQPLSGTVTPLNGLSSSTIVVE